MAIYTRWGSVVTLKRPAVKEDVKKLEGRKFDKHDAERMKYCMYAVGTIDGKDREVLFDLGMLRADDGINEINTAARAVGCDPQ